MQTLTMCFPGHNFRAWAATDQKVVRRERELA
jgi:hypothetical protein